MKNSEWYHKLWRKKLDEYPLPDHTNSSWLEMRDLLDKHLPVTKPSFIKKHGKSVGSKLVAKLGFVLPAAAMIGTVTYFAANHHVKNKPVNKQQISIKKITHAPNTPDSLLKPDTSLNIAKQLNTPKQAIPDNTPKGPAVTATNIVQNNTVTFQSNSAGIMAAQKLNRPVAGTQGYAMGPAPFSGPQLPSLSPPALTFFQDIDWNNVNIISVPVTAGQPGVNTLDIVTENTLYPASKNGFTGNQLTGPAGITVDAAAPITTDAGRNRQNKPGKKQRKTKKIKPGKITRDRSQPDLSLFNYGLFVALNTAHSSSNMSLGLTASYTVQPGWLINLGVAFDLSRPLSSTYTRPSYFPRDSSVSLHITDKQKVNIWSVPITLEHRLSKIVSINAGPQISIIAKQTRSTDGPAKYVGYVPQTKDTLGFSKSIDSALNKTTFNKLSLGISVGISVHLNRFYLDARYLQQVIPYQFNNSYFGNSRLYDHSLQIGFRYMLKNNMRH